MTAYLLDTNILYWSRFEANRLPISIRKLLEDGATPVAYSVIGPWEMAIKQARKKISISEEFYSGLPKLGFDCLDIKEAHVQALRGLPLLHHDPFDRMLVAQAKAEKMTLITSDKRLAAYPIKTLIA